MTLFVRYLTNWSILKSSARATAKAARASTKTFIHLKELVLVSILMLAAPFMQNGITASNQEDAHDFLPKRRVELTHAMSYRPEAIPAIATRVSQRQIATPQAPESLPLLAQPDSCEPIVTALDQSYR